MGRSRVDIHQADHKHILYCLPPLLSSPVLASTLFSSAQFNIPFAGIHIDVKVGENIREKGRRRLCSGKTRDFSGSWLLISPSRQSTRRTKTFWGNRLLRSRIIPILVSSFRSFFSPPLHRSYPPYRPYSISTYYIDAHHRIASTLVAIPSLTRDDRKIIEQKARLGSAS